MGAAGLNMGGGGGLGVENMESYGVQHRMLHKQPFTFSRRNRPNWSRSSTLEIIFLLDMVTYDPDSIWALQAGDLSSQ